MPTPMMKCGHAANAVSAKTNKPVCVICLGSPEAEEVAGEIDLTGRFAQCSSCKNTEPSRTDLAFFEYRGPGSKFAENECHVCRFHTKDKRGPDGKVRYSNNNMVIPHVCYNKGKDCVFGPFEYDRYYCGCRGWE